MLNLDFIESDLVALVERADGVHLTVIPTEPGYRDIEADYATHLDMRVDQSRVTRQYQAATDTTLVTMPYASTALVQFVTKSGVSGQIGGAVIPAVRESGTQYRLEGNHTSTQFYAGEQYTFRYRMSPPMLREDAPGGGLQSVTAGRLQLRKMSVQYASSGYFRAEVTPFARETYQYPFTGRVMGSGRNVLGQVSLEDGRFDFPVYGKNDQVRIELVNDTFLPCKLLGAEWTGMYAALARRT